MKIHLTCLILTLFSLNSFAQKKSQKVPKEITGYERKILDINIDGIKDKALYFASKVKGKKPLLIFLHGAGGRNRDVTKVNCQFTRGFSNFDLVCDVVHPASPGMWNPKAIDELIVHMLKTYDLDPSRVYVAGFSMGGAGTWYHIFEGQQPVAAYMPMGSGASKTGKVHEKWDISQIGDKQIWMIHGDKDKVVPYANAKESADLISKVAPNFKFTTLKGVPHTAGDTYKKKETFTWLLSHKTK